MKTICIIGAGNIGSRHLQGLKKITFPLTIEVIDPSTKSLEIAKVRYNQIQSSTNHKIIFAKNLDKVSRKIDLSIIATSSNVRRKVIETLLAKSSIKYLILEKILFQKKQDYFETEELLKKKGCKVWVNFSMRTMPFYYNLKAKFKGPIQMMVSGSQFGLITNAIHFVDYISFLTNCNDFTLDPTGLDPQPVESKRKGFLELNGTLNIYFKDGSIGSFTCYPSGDAPYIIEEYCQSYRCISKESERKAWISKADDWIWKEVNTNIPYQSDMTNIVVEKIFNTHSCALTQYSQAAKLHLLLLEPILKFLNKNSTKKFNLYPFT